MKCAVRLAGEGGLAEDQSMTRRAGFAFVLGALLLALFVNNGLWQLRRHDQKQAQQALFDATSEARPIARWDRLETPQRVLLRGRWHAAGTVFLDNRSYRGRPGFHVLTPLRLVEEGGAVMVNRGWVAAGPDRRQLPAIPTPEEIVQVSGRVMTPTTEGFSLGESVAEPSIWQRIDPRRFASQVTGPVAAVYVQQEGMAADGLVRDWPRPDFGTGKHLGYAFQWFAFAVMTLGWMLWVGLRKLRVSRG